MSDGVPGPKKLICAKNNPTAPLHHECKVLAPISHPAVIGSIPDQWQSLPTYGLWVTPMGPGSQAASKLEVM